jgi:hypothetical protein
LAQFASTTSDQLRGVISNETGTGALVFGTAPTITLPNATGLPLSTGVTGILPTANGGTGVDNSTGGTANQFWARPNGATGAATYRAIVPADIPTLNQNTTGSAATLTTTRTIGGSNFNGSANVTSFPAPGAIGGTTPSTGVFTTLEARSATSLLLGTAGTAVGSVGFRNATSGTITIAPPTGALGTVALTLPDTAGTLLVSGGPLATPSSGTLTSCTGLPISTGISGLGTGIAAALAINTGSAGAPVLFNGAGGTPSSLTLTNATGLPAAGVTGLGSLATQSALGNITSAGAIGSTSGLPIITTTSGVLTAGAFGTTAGTFAEGNDSRITGALSASTAASTYQPLDGDLTSIAALTTTTYGRSQLTLADATADTAQLNVFSSSLKGLAPASGGGTSNFLRADGTWAAPGGGGATNLTYTAATRVIASDTGTDATLPLVSSGDAGLAPASGGGTNKTLQSDGTWAARPIRICIAVSDETTALTTGTNKVRFRMPRAMTLTEVRATVNTAPTGSTLIVDINEGDTPVSILSTKLSIDASEKTSTTAATTPVISDAALADDAEISVDIDQIGATVAGAGLKVWLIGTEA